MSNTGASNNINNAIASHTNLSSPPVDPALLAWAESWYPIAWKGLIVAGVITAIGAVATIAFLLLQWRTTSIREEQSEWRTASLELQTETARNETARLSKESDQLRKDASDANERTAILEKQAEELRAANLALEAKIKPRRISGEDAIRMLPPLSNLAAALPDHPGQIKLPIGIVSRMGDPDSVDFANDLEKVFKDAGWNPIRIHNWTQVDKGVFFATRIGTPLPAEVEAVLATAFDAADIKHQTISIAENDVARIPPGFQPNVLYLIIGAKP